MCTVSSDHIEMYWQLRLCGTRHDSTVTNCGTDELPDSVDFVLPFHIFETNTTFIKSICFGACVCFVSYISFMFMLGGLLMFLCVGLKR